MNTKSAETNRLIHEKSPYLRQHAHNPVDWYPWGPEALEKARLENKPIFLSVGYSTCHWCHVMERESFENVEIARLLNAHFVSIKVDREERPDLDQIYMTAVQALTGSGGWPMTVFLTPEGQPFFGGTYFPPEDRWGRTGFRALLARIHTVWTKNREDVLASAERLTTLVRRASGVPARAEQVRVGRAESGPTSAGPTGAGPVSAGPAGSGPAGTARAEKIPETAMDARNIIKTPELEALHAAYQGFAARFDDKHGGFGPAPKFPTPHNLTFLLRYAHRTGEKKALGMVTRTLDGMAAGGLYDHLGGGFHRYSTDDRWLAPHFEKMLYDQAGLALAYAEAFQVTRDPAYAEVLRGILEYVLRDLRHPGGGFYSAEDADSEGEEGTFYVWTAPQIDAALGEDAPAFKAAFDVNSEGNWEGKTILRRRAPRPALSPEIEEGRRRLFDLRAERSRPHRDEKILGTWNGYMIEALATASRVLEEPRYHAAARQAARFIREHLWEGGRMQRYYLDGLPGIAAYADDYAFLGRGELALYEASLDLDHLEEARRNAGELIRLFRHEDGVFFMTGRDRDGRDSRMISSKESGRTMTDSPGTGSDGLLAPVVDGYDGALPSGNAAAAGFLLRLGHLLGDQEVEEAGRSVLSAFAPAIEQAPLAHVAMLNALDFELGPRTDIVLAGQPADAREDQAIAGMLKVVWGAYRPRAVWVYDGAQEAIRTRELIPRLRVQGVVANQPSAYVCRDYTCHESVHTTDDLAVLLDDLDQQDQLARLDH